MSADGTSPAPDARPTTLLAGLLGDDEIARLFEAEAEAAALLRVELALAAAEAEVGLIAPEAARAIADAGASLALDLPALARATARDGVPVPELVRQLRAAVPAEHRDAVHVGATSQDIVDTAFALRTRDVLAIVDARLVAVEAALATLDARFGQQPLTGRTRMRAALPIRVGDRLAAWRRPLATHRARAEALRPRLLVVQLAGPVGTRAPFGERADAVTRAFAAALDLNVPAGPWHTDRSAVVELAAHLALVAGSLGKLGQDVCLMAQDGVDEIALQGGGGSSAMPHKSNPVGAETLVALARNAAVLAGGVGHALVHEQERSGAAWTLEWLLLPPLCETVGAATRTALALLGNVERIGCDEPGRDETAV